MTSIPPGLSTTTSPAAGAPAAHAALPRHVRTRRAIMPVPGTRSAAEPDPVARDAQRSGAGPGGAGRAAKRSRCGGADPADLGTSRHPGDHEHPDVHRRPRGRRRSGRVGGRGLGGRAGHDVVLADAAVFPRDKACGDGLTPRAIAELDRLGLGDWVRGHGPQPRAARRRLRPGVLLPWPGGALPDHGGAVPRTELDARIRDGRPRLAAPPPLDGARAVDVERDGDRVTGVVFASDGPEPFTVALPAAGRRRRRPVAARPGARAASGTARPPTAWRPAATSRSGRSDDEWISSHLELRGADGELLSGYGWVFPLGRRRGEHRRRHAGHRPPSGRRRSCRRCSSTYTEPRRDEWELEGDGARRRRRRCCRWAVRCPAWPGATGR